MKARESLVPGLFIAWAICLLVMTFGCQSPTRGVDSATVHGLLNPVTARVETYLAGEDISPTLEEEYDLKLEVILNAGGSELPIEIAD